MITTIIIKGKPRSGKTTIAELLNFQSPDSRIIRDCDTLASIKYLIVNSNIKNYIFDNSKIEIIEYLKLFSDNVFQITCERIKP